MAGQLFVISGPSGVGKTTLLRAVQQDRRDLVESVSSTTRSRREGEVDGRDYCFVSREDFLAGVDRGDFLEWAEVHGNLYGTDASRIASERAAGKHVALIIDVEGERQVKALIPEAHTIFVMPPSEEVLAGRLSARGTETEQSLALRLTNAKREMFFTSRFEFVITNDNFELALYQLGEVIDHCTMMSVDPMALRAEEVVSSELVFGR